MSTVKQNPVGKFAGSKSEAKTKELAAAGFEPAEGNDITTGAGSVPRCRAPHITRKVL